MLLQKICFSKNHGLYPHVYEEYVRDSILSSSTELLEKEKKKEVKAKGSKTVV